MEKANMRPKADGLSSIESRATKRLAADLLRFQKAYDRLERQRLGLGAIAPDAPADETPASDGDVRDYLNCLDTALAQLAEEFANDETLIRARQRAAGDGATSEPGPANPATPIMPPAMHSPAAQGSAMA